MSEQSNAEVIQEVLWSFQRTTYFQDSISEKESQDRLKKSVDILLSRMITPEIRAVLTAAKELMLPIIHIGVEKAYPEFYKLWVSVRDLEEMEKKK